MAERHSQYCRKEKEIAEIYTKIITIERIVMGNGQEGLATSVPKLSQSIETLSQNLILMERGMKGFLRYQQTMEGKDDGKAEMKKRTRWVIGLMIGIILSLVGGLITTIHLLVQAGGG